MTTLTISAACLIDDADRLLLVRKRNTQSFMLPGGKAEPGEPPITALLRELQEELNLILPPAALQLLGRFHAAAANEPNTWIDASVFQAYLPHSVSAAAELEELRWLAPGDELPATLAPLLREHVLSRLWPAA
jgi:8-oxo-dGTP pyrophosphatase MutT (NUDIX family)